MATKTFTIDELGFIQLANAEVLAAAARGEIDLYAIARQELGNRGLDWSGKWIGFTKAQALAKCYPTRTANGRTIAVSVPQD